MLVNRLDLLQELHDHAESFLWENFNQRLKIPVNINNRLRTVGGRFRSRHNGVARFDRAVDIEIAKFVCETGTKEEIFDILEHECIHYALFERKEPFGDNDRHFRETCKRLNVGLNHSIIKQKHVYACPECGVVIEHYRKIPKGYYLPCDHCNGKISEEHLSTIKSMKVRQVL